MDYQTGSGVMQWCSTIPTAIDLQCLAKSALVSIMKFSSLKMGFFHHPLHECMACESSWFLNMTAVQKMSMNSLPLSGFAQSNACQPLIDWSPTLPSNWCDWLSLGNHWLIPTSNPHPQCYDSESTWEHLTKQLYSSSDAVGTPQLDLWG